MFDLFLFYLIFLILKDEMGKGLLPSSRRPKPKPKRKPKPFVDSKPTTFAALLQKYQLNRPLREVVLSALLVYHDAVRAIQIHRMVVSFNPDFEADFYRVRESVGMFMNSYDEYDILSMRPFPDIRSDEELDRYLGAMQPRVQSATKTRVRVSLGPAINQLFASYGMSVAFGPPIKPRQVKAKRVK